MKKQKIKFFTLLRNDIWFIIMTAMTDKNKKIICGIVALGPNNVIGHNGVMPWHSRQDFYHFKNMTMGKPCIFGKNTYENLPKKPLPGRMNIVCSSLYKTEQIDGCLHVPSLEEAIKQCGNTDLVFICGGAVLYKYALDKDLIDIMYVTEIQTEGLVKEIKANPDAYTYFNYNFDSKKWLKTQIYYPSGFLPEENFGTRALFYKYTRTR